MSISTTAPPARRVPAPPGEPEPTVDDPGRRAGAGLATAIDAGLRALSDLFVPRHEVTSGELERALRDAVEQHRLRSVPATRGAAGPGDDTRPTERGRLADAAVAVRVACAYLDAGNPADARLALRCAHEALPRRDRREVDTPGPAPSRARAADEAVRGRLRDRTVVAQAVGVLTEHSGGTPSGALSALHGYAARHRFVVRELAADLVAGRVAPGVVHSRPRVPRRGRAQ